MIGEFSNEFGKVFVVAENSFVLEKYYNGLDLLFDDESYLINEIFNIKILKVYIIKLLQILSQIYEYY